MFFRTAAVFSCLISLPLSSRADDAPLSERFRRLPIHLLNDAVSGVYDPSGKSWNWAGLTIAGATAVTSYSAYRFVDRDWQVDKKYDLMGKSGNAFSVLAYVMAGAPAIYLGVGWAYPAGSALRNRSFDTAEETGEALLFSGGIAYLLKSVTGRWRPNGTNDKSFPSFHTAVAFSAAGSLYATQPLYIGLPALLAAGFVGATRIDLREHFASDVFAGAGLGLFFAAAVHHFHRDRDAAEVPRTAFVPLIDGGTVGLGMIRRF